MFENINRINSIEKLKDLIRIQKTIMDNTPLLQYAISPDGIILDCNKLVLKTLGHKNKKDLVGKPLISTVYAPSSIEKAKKLSLIWEKTGTIKNEELQIKTLKGRLIDILLNVNTLYDKNGKSRCSICTQVDITQYKKKTEKPEQKIEKEKILLTDRNYIARELHDTVTQTLFSANLIAEVLPRLWRKDPKGVIKRLNEIRMLNSVALTEMRSLLFDLRPSSFKNEELGELLKELVKFMGIKSKIPISVEIVKKYGYSHRIELSFYRIAQEALNNIAKHSYATKAKLVLKSLSDKITMDIDDDGVGFNPKDTTHENLGLIIMKERAKIIDASFDLESNPGKGTKISVIYYNNNKKNYE